VIALLREVSLSLAGCELTHLARTPIDPLRARLQHAEYAAALTRLGCEVTLLPALEAHPDAVFVEDCAVVLDEVAILTRPGAASRRGEVDSIAAALEPWRECVALAGNGTLDGGDVLTIGRRLFVGRSARTDDSGIRALGAAVGPFGYEVVPVAVTGCLHLKTGVGLVGDDRLLINPAWVDAAPFGGMQRIEVDPEEPMAANALAVGGKVIFPRQYPRTAERLTGAGFALEMVDADELAKAEGGVTCCSLVFQA